MCEQSRVMSMKQDEIDDLISKLRLKYSDYGQKHNPKWFSVEEFEKRYIMALKNRMNLEAFILAEIANFEKIKEKYDKKKKQKSFSEQVDKIIEENNSRIKKYPPKEFHPLASMEIKYLLGALEELVLYYMPILMYIGLEGKLKDALYSFEDTLGFLAMTRGSRSSKRIDDHINILARKDVEPIEIERDKNDYLKESAFTLHDILDFCNNLIKLKNPEWEFPLRLDKLFIEETRKRKMLALFSECTSYGAIFKVKEYISNLIDDFRLHAFRKSK